MFGDPTADDIWALARDRHDGISRTEARNLFGRNKKGREIDRALGALPARSPSPHRRPRPTR
ncbi:MAG: hypothetical protein WCD11_03440 [Solirubrobacteraceae bacterium]